MQRGERECFMRIAVFSDSHGVKEPMLAAIEEQKPDMVLHLGDYVRDAEAIAAYFPSLDLRYVRGNCDAYSRSDAEENLLFNADGVRIFMTHGHRYNTAHLPPLQPGDILLHGHTHIPAWEQFGCDNLYLNPGSVSIPKENSAHGYMTLQDGVLVWKDLDGAAYHTLHL